MIRLRVLLTERDIEAAEGISAASAVGWGLVVALPVDTFALSRSYALMAAWAPESAWGLGIALLGLVQAAALYRDWRRPRRVMACLAFSLWLFLAALFGYSSTWYSPAVPAFLVLAAFSSWAYLRLSHAQYALAQERQTLRRQLWHAPRVWREGAAPAPAPAAAAGGK